jgi:formamidopyrimidine-DNA glycosylase
MTIEGATSRGGLVEIRAEKTMVLFGDGVNIRFHDVGEPHPSRHQFLLEFEDRSALSAAVQMYGGVGAFIEGELSNPYYMVAREKPSPFSEEFDLEHFQKIVTAPEVRKSTMKMLLATEQRIPGLGNGVLQDILFNSRMHPRKKVNTLGEKDIERLFDALKGTLTAMAEQRGRDTEVDIYGRPGGYRTILSKNTLGKECPVCGTAIKKETYLGGTVYYCEKCQQT